MKILKELSKVSNYRPKKGLKYELFKLVKMDNYTRVEAVKYFDSINKKGQFYDVYKRLKYSLLNGVLANTNDIPPSYLRKVQLWKRNIQIRLLFITGNLISAVKLANQNIVVAENNNELEVVVSLCKELKRHYSINEPNYLKYLKYKEKFDWANWQLQAQLKAESAYQELNLCLKTKRPINELQKEIEVLDKMALETDYYFFLYHYFKLKSLYFRSIQDEQSFFKNNQKAIEYLENQNTELPYQVKYNFLADLVPYYIIKGQFFKAGNSINTCEQLPPIGSFNWHKILLYRAFLGFYSQKPKVALNAFKMAFSVKAKTDSPVIFERWHLIEGYLGLYNQLDNVPLPKEFKIGKYLNIQEKRNNHTQKANLLIIELLYYLFSHQRSQYFDLTEKLDHYIKTRFKAHEFKRTRYFLRMLKAVVKGNYHHKLIQEHARNNFRKLVASKNEIGVDSLNIEFVPYEILWGEVIEFLSKK